MYVCTGKIQTILVEHLGIWSSSQEIQQRNQESRAKTESSSVWCSSSTRHLHGNQTTSNQPSGTKSGHKTPGVENHQQQENLTKMKTHVSKSRAHNCTKR